MIVECGSLFFFGVCLPLTGNCKLEIPPDMSAVGTWYLYFACIFLYFLSPCVLFAAQARLSKCLRWVW